MPGLWPQLFAEGRQSHADAGRWGMSAKSFKAALVGCGRISQNHFEAIAAVDGLALRAVCDVVPERARDAGEKLGVPWFTSYDEMIKKAECDVVVIATPSGLHPAHGIKAAQA